MIMMIFLEIIILLMIMIKIFEFKKKSQYFKYADIGLSFIFLLTMLLLFFNKPLSDYVLSYIDNHREHYLFFLLIALMSSILNVIHYRR